MGVAASAHDQLRVGAAFRSKAPDAVLATLLKEDDEDALASDTSVQNVPPIDTAAPGSEALGAAAAAAADTCLQAGG